MKKISVMVGFVLLGCSLHAMAMDNNQPAGNHQFNDAYETLAASFFPNIKYQVFNCASNWNEIKPEDRGLIEAGYLKEATKALKNNWAPKLKQGFEAIAKYHSVPTDVILKLFGCARYVTGHTSEGTNHFVEANKLVLKFTPKMLDLFHKNIDQMRESFAGDAATKEGKIENIEAHIKTLKQMRIMQTKADENLIRKSNQHDAIINYILTFDGDERLLAVEFALVTALSSLEIVKQFVPPSYFNQAFIVSWNAVADTVGFVSDVISVFGH